jgi:putative transposase
MVLTELRNRGLVDVLIACVDGLKGFPEAIEAVYPMTQVQLCIVHMVRNSLNYVGYKERKAVAADLKEIYGAPTAEAAAEELKRFTEKWGKQYAAITALWQRNWERVIPFLAFPAEIRKIIYTTNTVEALNRSFRKIIKSRGAFPSEEAAIKLLYLAMRNAVARWNRSVLDWKVALNQFTLLWEDRIRAAARS